MATTDPSVVQVPRQRTRAGLPPNSRIRSWVAEAPCRHTIQVGDSSSKMRISLLAALNFVLDFAHVLGCEASQGALAGRNLAPAIKVG